MTAEDPWQNADPWSQTADPWAQGAAGGGSPSIHITPPFAGKGSTGVERGARQGPPSISLASSLAAPNSDAWGSFSRGASDAGKGGGKMPFSGKRNDSVGKGGSKKGTGKRGGGRPVEQNTVQNEWFRPTTGGAQDAAASLSSASAPEPASGAVGRGRGRGMVKPAWQTSTGLASDSPPSIPEQPVADRQEEQMEDPWADMGDAGGNAQQNGRSNEGQGGMGNPWGGMSDEAQSSAWNSLYDTTSGALNAEPSVAAWYASQHSMSDIAPTAYDAGSPAYDMMGHTQAEYGWNGNYAMWENVGTTQPSHFGMEAADGSDAQAGQGWSGSNQAEWGNVGATGPSCSFYDMDAADAMLEEARAVEAVEAALQEAHASSAPEKASQDMCASEADDYDWPRSAADTSRKASPAGGPSLHASCAADPMWQAGTTWRSSSSQDSAMASAAQPPPPPPKAAASSPPVTRDPLAPYAAWEGLRDRSAPKPNLCFGFTFSGVEVVALQSCNGSSIGSGEWLSFDINEVLLVLHGQDDLIYAMAHGQEDRPCGWVQLSYVQLAEYHEFFVRMRSIHGKPLGLTFSIASGSSLGLVVLHVDADSMFEAWNKRSRRAPQNQVLPGDFITWVEGCCTAADMELKLKAWTRTPLRGDELIRMRVSRACSQILRPSAGADATLERFVANTHTRVRTDMQAHQRNQLKQRDSEFNQAVGQQQRHLAKAAAASRQEYTGSGHSIADEEPLTNSQVRTSVPRWQRTANPDKQAGAAGAPPPGPPAGPSPVKPPPGQSPVRPPGPPAGRPIGPPAGRPPGPPVGSPPVRPAPNQVAGQVKDPVNSANPWSSAGADPWTDADPWGGTSASRSAGADPWADADPWGGTSTGRRPEAPRKNPPSGPPVKAALPPAKAALPPAKAALPPAKAAAPPAKASMPPAKAAIPAAKAPPQSWKAPPAAQMAAAPAGPPAEPVAQSTEFSETAKVDEEDPFAQMVEQSTGTTATTAADSSAVTAETKPSAESDTGQKAAEPLTYTRDMLLQEKASSSGDQSLQSDSQLPFTIKEQQPSEEQAKEPSPEEQEEQLVQQLPEEQMQPAADVEASPEQAEEQRDSTCEAPSSSEAAPLEQCQQLAQQLLEEQMQPAAEKAEEHCDNASEALHPASSEDQKQEQYLQELLHAQMQPGDREETLEECNAGQVAEASQIKHDAVEAAQDTDIVCSEVGTQTPISASAEAAHEAKADAAETAIPEHEAKADAVETAIPAVAAGEEECSLITAEPGGVTE